MKVKSLSYSRYIEKSFYTHWNLPSMTDYPGKALLYSDVAENIFHIHVLFENYGIKPGDKIAICGRNCSNWAITFLAITTFGTVAVPLLHEFTPENIHYIVGHSDSKILFVSKKIWANLDFRKIDFVKVIVALDDFSILKAEDKDNETAQNLWYDTSHNRLLHKFSRETFSDMIYHYDREELLVLNYTSGTTSNPKGVMIPSRAVASNITFGVEVMPTIHAGDRMVVFYHLLIHTAWRLNFLRK